MQPKDLLNNLNNLMKQFEEENKKSELDHAHRMALDDNKLFDEWVERGYKDFAMRLVNV